jgi:hypothetical protein
MSEQASCKDMLVEGDMGGGYTAEYNITENQKQNVQEVHALHMAQI